jgi:hypothetical protein
LVLSLDADKDLTFSVDESMQYVAEEIPRQVGMKAGSVVVGFVKGGHDANDVIPVKATQRDKRITLGELAKRHKINLNEDTLVVNKRTAYCTHLCKVDTKEVSEYFCNCVGVADDVPFPPDAQLLRLFSTAYPKPGTENIFSSGDRKTQKMILENTFKKFLTT